MSTAARDARDRLAEWTAGDREYARELTLAADLLTLIAGWDEARARLARVEALRAEWQRDLDSGGIRDADARYCWQTAANEVGKALGGDE